jgi:hypothetical protein
MPLFDEMTSEEEFKRRVGKDAFFSIGDVELKKRQIFFHLKSFRAQIESTNGEPLLMLAVTKEGPNLRIQQYIDESHPVNVIALRLEKHHTEEVDVRFEVRLNTIITIRPDEGLPPVDKVPVSLVNPVPDFTEWYAPLSPVKQFLRL